MKLPDAVMTADPDFLELAWEEVARDAPGAERLAIVDEEVLLVSLPGGFWELAAGWQERPPIFVRHLNPVQASRPLPPGDNAIYALQATVLDELAPLLDPSLTFSVQTRLLAEVAYGPYDVNSVLAPALQAESGAALDVRAPEQVLSVVVAPYQGQTIAFLGLSPAVYNLSDWAGGKRRFAREKGQISRAEFKLLEALEQFGLALPPGGVALDLGAAPGGWTRVLRQREQFVTAVDPAALHPQLDADRQVRQKRMTAEAYLADEPDQFDLIVNDMRLDARDSARLMVAYAPHLYRHGAAIMTLKLPQEARKNVLDHAFNILREAYEIAGARQLFHNRSEITVLLRPRTRGGGQ